MNFIVGAEKGLAFYQEETAFTGVNKIADKVRKDVRLVAGFMPEITQSRADLGMYSVIYGTVGRSPVLDELNEKGIIDL
ncbi:hypothetical protein [Paenibacillus sp. VMFN-D1]|uniref:hypothetical protein n=1 Tax=Paenibacillus sp. VMFN-D1 TaxID=2135608 RepID=UPI000E3B290E|nr:hypothetical protein [Paenibacillus sp. VMFN-D1]RED40303.1 hypothetical protein C7820_1463 [Paenibacillus sp. VMFN-D1]